MLTQRDVWARSEYNKDLARAAARERLVRQARTRDRASLYAVALSRLGRRMIVWGKSLQERHGAALGGALGKTPDRAMTA